MRKLSLFWTMMALLVMRGNLWAASTGPELKFEPESQSSESQKAGTPYGEKPLLKFGSDRSYFRLGGYGSIRFSTDTAQDINDTFTFRRLVLTTDAMIASKFRIYTEIEFERFRKVEFESNVIAQDGGITVSQEIEGVNHSELSLEQAWFDLEFKPYIHLQGGAVLVPVGRFNINHDDNLWNLPRRSLVDRGVPVLPVEAAWDELGFGLNGDVDLGEKARMNYRIYVVNGVTLNPQLEQAAHTRFPDHDELELEAEFGINTGTFSQDVKSAKAVTGRVAFSPALGHEIGLSGYWGRYTPSFLPGKNLTMFGFDWLSSFGNFDIEAEYILSHYGGMNQVLTAFAAQAGNTTGEFETGDSTNLETEIAMKPSGLADTKQGYWVEMRYHIRPDWLTKSWFGRNFSDPQFIPIVRWEQAFISGLVTEFEADNNVVTKLTKQNRRVDRITAGMAFRLNPIAVFHMAYEYTQTNKGQSLASVTNYLPTPSSSNHSFMFGAAFGF